MSNTPFEKFRVQCSAFRVEDRRITVYLFEKFEKFEGFEEFEKFEGFEGFEEFVICMLI